MSIDRELKICLIGIVILLLIAIPLFIISSPTERVLMVLVLIAGAIVGR